MECQSERRLEGSVVFQTRLPLNHEGSHTWDSRCKNTISYDHASPQQNLQWHIYILLISRQKHLQWQIKVHQGLIAMQITLVKPARKSQIKKGVTYTTTRSPVRSFWCFSSNFFTHIPRAVSGGISILYVDSSSSASCWFGNRLSFACRQRRE